MSKTTDLFNVCFFRNGELQSVAFYGKPQAEAQRIAQVLNDGLQDKAKALGFYYAVKEQAKKSEPWWVTDPTAQAEMRRGA